MAGRIAQHPPSGPLEPTLIKMASYLGDFNKKLSDESGNPIARQFHKRFVKDRFLTYGIKLEGGPYKVHSKNPTNAMTVGAYMQYDIKNWFIEPGFSVGFGNVRNILYSLSVNKLMADKHSTPYVGAGLGLLKSTARLYNMEPAIAPGTTGRVTSSGGYFFLEFGYCFSRRSVYNLRLAAKPGITAFDLNGGKMANINLSATFSIAP